jgi:hypothetical protein
MTVLDHSRTSSRDSWSPRLRRRHEIVTTGGVQGVLDIGTALNDGGFPVSDFVVDVRDGVVYSSVTCTVSLTSAELTAFTERMATVPSVISVEPV